MLLWRRSPLIVPLSLLGMRQNADVQGLMHALGLALHCFHEDKQLYKEVQLTGMRRDSSWDTAATNYEQVFTWAKADLPVTG